MSINDNSTESLRQQLKRLGRLPQPVFASPSSGLDRESKVRHYLADEAKHVVELLKRDLKVTGAEWVDDPRFQCFVDSAIKRKARELASKPAPLSNGGRPKSPLRRSAEFFDFSWFTVRSRFRTEP